METAWLVELAGVWLTVLFTLSVYSFLYRDNPFYKMVEHLYVGVAAGYFHLHADLPTYLKLFAITGFLGGLTTFSSFSAEVVERLLIGQIGLALGLATLHLCGSLLGTWLGILSVGAGRVWS